MEEQPRNSSDSQTTPLLKEFKTMEIQTKSSSTGSSQPFYPQSQNPSYYTHLYSPIIVLIMSFWQNESNKKFYKNQVLNTKMSQLGIYDDLTKIKQNFPSCATVNRLLLSFKGLKQAEFFILRSTCDDDIHKAIKYGVWTSTNYTNHILNNRFKECSRHNIPLFLVFTYFKKSG